MSLIRLEKICKTYYMKDLAQPVLFDVSLNIKAGEMIALMGESGSGKSTMMNIIGMLDKASSGQYFLDEQDVSTLKEDAMATIRNKTIGFVFQQFFLLPKLTAWQNIELPLLYRGETKSVRKQKVDEILEKVGMSDRAYHRPSELSGGQQQRIAIARSLVGSPKLILADEPTGALDTKTAQEVMSLFKSLHQEGNSTLLIVTHSPSVGAQCERQIRMQDGRIKEGGR